jgi:hypothetical protein
VQSAESLYYMEQKLVGTEALYSHPMALHDIVIAMLRRCLVARQGMRRRVRGPLTGRCYSTCPTCRTPAGASQTALSLRWVLPAPTSRQEAVKKQLGAQSWKQSASWKSSFLASGARAGQWERHAAVAAVGPAHIPVAERRLLRVTAHACEVAKPGQEG